MLTGQTVLELDDVTYSYSSTLVVSRVGLSVSRGECVALTGPSGCGKSTVLLLAAGILAAAEGKVISNGVDLTSAPREVRASCRRRQVGMVFQFGELISELTLVDNVALSCELAGMSRRSAVSRAREVLESVGLAGLERRKPGEVSGGQAQRAAVARAVAHSPALILADEPTGALDQPNGRAVLDVLLEAARAHDAGLLLVTHDDAVARACDAVLRMDDGVLRGGATARV